MTLSTATVRDFALWTLEMVSEETETKTATDSVRFLHPTTRRTLTGTYLRTQAQTGEILVNRTDDGSRVWVRPADIR